MFKRVFQSISKTFSGKEEVKEVLTPPAPRTEAPAGPPKTSSLLDKVAGASAPPEKKKVPIAPAPSISPEEMCGVTDGMGKDEIRSRLALLYRRYNRASSSLDAKLRAEAEKMLDAVVTVREKNFGPI